MTYALRDDEEVATSAGAAGLRYLTFAGKLVAKALLDATQLDAEINPVLLKHARRPRLVFDHAIDATSARWLDGAGVGVIARLESSSVRAGMRSGRNSRRSSGPGLALVFVLSATGGNRRHRFVSHVLHRES